MKKILSYCLGFFFSAVILLFLTNCSSSGRADKITRLDSLATALNHIEKELNDLNRETVKDAYLNCKENLQQLHLVFQQNPLAVEESQLLQYESLTINMNRLVSDLDNIEKEIQFAVQQVTEWKNSVAKGAVSSEDFQQYCKTETEAIRSLEQILLTKKGDWQKDQAQLDNLNPVIKKLISKK